MLLLVYGPSKVSYCLSPTYPIDLPINLPDTPFTLVMDHLLNVAHAAIAASPLRPRALDHLGDELPTLPLGMRIYLPSGNDTSPLANLQMTEPGYDLFGVLEATGTDVKPLEDRLLVLLVPVLVLILVLLACMMRLGSCLVALAMNGEMAEEFFAVVARVPCTEEEVA